MGKVKGKGIYTYNHPQQSWYWDTSNSPPRTSASRQRYSPDRCSGAVHSARVRHCIGRRHPGRRLCRIRVWISGCRREGARLRCPTSPSPPLISSWLHMFCDVVLGIFWDSKVRVKEGGKHTIFPSSVDPLAKMRVTSLQLPCSSSLAVEPVPN